MSAPLRDSGGPVGGVVSDGAPEPGGAGLVAVGVVGESGADHAVDAHHPVRARQVRPGIGVAATRAFLVVGKGTNAVSDNETIVD